MTHPGVEQLLSYLDGVTEIDRGRIEQHVSECPACRDQITVLGFIGESLAVPPPATFSPDFEARTLLVAGRQPRSRWISGDVRVAAVGVVAAALMLGLLLASGDLRVLASWASTWAGGPSAIGESLRLIAGPLLALLLFGSLDRFLRVRRQT